MEPSAGLILTMRCRFFMPIPQVALHSSHSPHSVVRQLLGAGSPAGWCQQPPPLRPRPAPPGASLTALFVDRAFLRLLGGQRAHGAILRKLLHVPLPGPHAGATGDAAGRPGDPLGHGARGAVCNTEWTPLGLARPAQQAPPRAEIYVVSWHSGGFGQLRMEANVKGAHFKTRNCSLKEMTFSRCMKHWGLLL